MRDFHRNLLTIVSNFPPLVRERLYKCNKPEKLCAVESCHSEEIQFSTEIKSNHEKL